MVNQSVALRTWPLWLPVLAASILATSLIEQTTGFFELIKVAALLGAVISAVHHAEVIAQKVGEPYGTLVLALAVTVIEVALILSLMLTNATNAASIPRDTVYAAVMIICTESSDCAF